MKKIIYSLFIINLFIIIFFWGHSSGSLLFKSIPDFVSSLGMLFGLLAVYFVLLQFLMMGRSMWIEKVFGLDKIARVHRLNGYASITFILLHPIFIVTAYSISGKINLLSAFMSMVTSSDDLVEALIAVILFCFIVFFSIYIVRRHLKYEFWYFVHLFTYLAILLAWGHQLKFGSDFVGNNLFVFYWYALYIFVFGNVLLFRFIRPVYNSLKYSFYVTDIVKENDSVTSVYIGGKNIENFKIQAGQFLIFRFLSKNFWWEAHPFSLSWSPKNKQIRSSMKAVGDFTKKINSLKKGTKVYIDGPYGIFTQKVLSSNKVLFIAAGIGITPIRSLIEDMGEQKKDMILLYSNKLTNEIVFQKELDNLAQKYKFPIHYIISQDPTYKGEKGRIDAEKLKRLVKDFKQRDVYICGPQPMIVATAALLLLMGVSKSKIHYEKFAL